MILVILYPGVDILADVLPDPIEILPIADNVLVVVALPTDSPEPCLTAEVSNSRFVRSNDRRD